ncbi:hypothetical protein C1E24_19925 [Pseudoalteromonas phenolica]|uniref:Copper-binding protein n=1 Tax=Pseudoalteromonas phenolica TaxID=161398 RepID=A0A5R9PY72_9GAMM|nr:hypothetical protein [Pseudoalteromonas phenolica]TLX45266.1 hypothetical protein C1E24_19925 [Pseudoalteromonas phenolica]
MFKFIASIMLFLSLVVSPFGQMTAFAAHECDMTMMTKDSMMHHTMAQDGMSKDIMSQDETMSSMASSTSDISSMDCCKVECVCPNNACHAFTYVPQSVQTLGFFSSFEKIQNAPLTPPATTISNLYRPPIFA